MPSQKGGLEVPPHRQKDTPLGLTTTVPSASVTSHGPVTRTGPLARILTLEAEDDSAEGVGSDVSNDKAPEGQANTALINSSSEAFSGCSQGRS